MKILHLNHLFCPGMFGGVARVVYNISKELTKKGYEVTVYTTNALDRERNFELKGREYVLHGFKVHYFKNVLRLDKLYISPSLISALRRDVKDFEVIHLHSQRQIHDPAACYYAKKYGAPYVLQAYGSLPRIMAKQRLKWIYDALFGDRLLRDASKVIALSQVEAEQYRSMGVPEEKIAVIPNGIDLSEYANLPSKGSFKKKFNIDEDARAQKRFA